ncbi:MAG: ParB/RepB/Spo0J family partition protein [Bacteroidetes bacterium]|jgi:ParB family chromosome partitioning protein|nr:ParB/RepB/Spo0J family partition protein [Bacteroidota bacterium]MBT3751401.1 ParB/RepB/Spo0J family partition protein [Bacteroidota bacterium]MBT4397898.1 ParB/RepB/Spo0J family partition protein [Bacteroidota bacterium]MBT4411517.1 ParB/RepB/Spo0J family partition protein [Bacteroidota bacterium]MBT5425902.1 ParB/RepB/Spo0J family partition protein [Bacteroidota bacterium]
MVAKKTVLGRGLGALIEDADVKPGASVNEIPISQIETNPFQPREKFDDVALEELADSIRELGIIQPITVRQTAANKYQLITGERRFRASIRVGLKKIPAYIRKADDQAMLELALVENIQREDLDAIEVAISYQRLIEECKLTQESMSERVGKKRSTISNYLRLLKLPAEIQAGIRNNELSMGHARALINIEDRERQLVIFNKVLRAGLSVRQTEQLVKGNKTKPKKPVKGTIEKSDQYDKLKDQLSRFFSTPVDFNRNQYGKGNIIIPFTTDADLERIIGILDQLDK